MDLYAVVCACERIVAWIDDRRPQAEHVFVQSLTSYTKSLRGAQTKGGAWYTYTFACRRCRLDVRLSEVTADEIIDKMAPIRGELALRPIRNPFRELAMRSDEQRAADQARAAKSLDDQLNGRPSAATADGPYGGAFAVYENRYVIPFAVLNQMITTLRDRGRR